MPRNKSSPVARTKRSTECTAYLPVPFRLTLIFNFARIALLMHLLRRFDGSFVLHLNRVRGALLVSFLIMIA